MPEESRVTHASPVLGCRCRQCHATRVAIYYRLPPAQRHALDVLSFAVPRHQTDLRMRESVRWQVLYRLQFAKPWRPTLVYELPLKTVFANATTMPFFCRNQHGDEIAAAVALDQRKAA